MTRLGRNLEGLVQLLYHCTEFVYLFSLILHLEFKITYSLFGGNSEFTGIIDDVREGKECSDFVREAIEEKIERMEE